MMDLKSLISCVISRYPNSEIASILSIKSDCGYYELCQSFLDVALNAPKVTTENGELAGVFQHTDINIAKNKAHSFLQSNNIKNLKEFFEILKDVYPLSESLDDTRQKTAVIRNYNRDYVGYAGTLYVFTKISDDIYDKIVEDIVETLKNEL